MKGWEVFFIVFKTEMLKTVLKRLFHAHDCLYRKMIEFSWNSQILMIIHKVETVFFCIKCLVISVSQTPGSSAHDFKLPLTHKTVTVWKISTFHMRLRTGLGLNVQSPTSRYRNTTYYLHNIYLLLLRSSVWKGNEFIQNITAADDTCGFRKYTANRKKSCCCINMNKRSMGYTSFIQPPQHSIIIFIWSSHFTGWYILEENAV